MVNPDLDLAFLKGAAPETGFNFGQAVQEANAAYFQPTPLAAKNKAEKDFDAALRHYVEQPRHYLFGGLCNAVSSLSALAEHLADEQEEFSDADADYRFAMQVLEAASQAVDLHYGDRSRKRGREENLARLMKALQEIRP